MRRLSIKNQLAILILLSLSLAVLIGAFQIRAAAKVSSGLTNAIASATIMRNHMEADMMHDALRADVIAALYDAKTGGKSKKEILEGLKEHSDHFREMIKENEGLQLSDNSRKALSEVKPTLTAYIDTAISITGKAYSNYDEGAKMLDSFLKVFEELEGKMSDLSDTIEKDAALGKDRAQAEAQTSATISLGATLLMTLFAVTGLWVLGSRIAKRADAVQKAAKELESAVIAPLTLALNKLAGGDLSYRPTIESVRMNEGPRDEIAAAFESMADRTEQMVIAYDEARTSLANTIQQMSVGADKLSQASWTMKQSVELTAQTSDEIASGSEALAEATSVTARSIEQLYNRIEVVAGSSTQQLQMVKESISALNTANETLDEVNRTSKQMAENASKGSDAVAKTILAMESISGQADQSLAVAQALKDKSIKIGSIVSAIEDVAAQTNLLSLNASIEAARAGEHGRGFAVVADEVRKLSLEASDAAKEIGVLLSDVSNSVNEVVQCFEKMRNEVALGAKRTTETGDVLETIIESIHQTVEKISVVSAEANDTGQKMRSLQDLAVEGNATTNEMRNIAGEVSESANSSAAIGEESAACAEELRSSTSQLVVAVADLEAVSSVLRDAASKFVTQETPMLKVAA